MKFPVTPPVAPKVAKPVAAIPPGQFDEPKWNGVRSIVFRDGDELEIGSRKARSMTRYLPDVVEAMRRNSRCAVIDGEIVIVGDGGPDFWAVQQRIHPAASRVALLAGSAARQLHQVRSARARGRRPHLRAVRSPPRRAGAGLRASRLRSTSRRSPATSASRATGSIASKAPASTA
jgi:ATP dependent DNA ligase-like protein